MPSYSASYFFITQMGGSEAFLNLGVKYSRIPALQQISVGL